MLIPEPILPSMSLRSPCVSNIECIFCDEETFDSPWAAYSGFSLSSPAVAVRAPAKLFLPRLPAVSSHFQYSQTTPLLLKLVYISPTGESSRVSPVFSSSYGRCFPQSAEMVAKVFYSLVMYKMCQRFVDAIAFCFWVYLYRLISEPQDLPMPRLTLSRFCPGTSPTLTRLAQIWRIQS